MFSYHHLDKWAFANLDLIEEILETHTKAVVVIAGASSSGKSYAASYLSKLLENNGHKAFTISLDQYNYGLSHIIPEKVNKNYFNSSLEGIEGIKDEIKEIIYDIPFEEKYADEALGKIENLLKDRMDPDTLSLFLKGLSEEWSHLNLDETSVYNLKEASEDVKILLDNGTVQTKLYSKIVSERVKNDVFVSGKDLDVIIVEGIYALDNEFLDCFKGFDVLVKNFISGSPKSLYLRRILRDLKISSASNAFTTKIYFTSIQKSYMETIYPSRLNADVMLYNDMSFAEMRAGDLYTTKDEIHTLDNEIIDYLLHNSEITSQQYQRDTYFVTPLEKPDSVQSNVLRLREVSPDGGKTYVPSSLVHKGQAKVRKDRKIIRPINVILKEGEFEEVWKDVSACYDDFLSAGFQIGKVKKKFKSRIVYKGQSLTLIQVEGEGNYIEIGTQRNEEVIDEIKKRIKDSL